MKAKDSSPARVSTPPLPDAPPASWVEKLLGVCGGEARIRRTRITVWGLVQRRKAGLSDAEIRERLPDLTQADLDVAWHYYEQHPDEIDQAIRENETA